MTGALPDGVPEEPGVQVVVFRLGGELHACDVQRVEEVVTGERLHPLPDVPPPLAGVIRLRGALVPVLDVAPVLGLTLREVRTPAVLIVEGDAGRVGVAVDEVREVTTLPASAIRRGGAGGEDEHVLGVARVDGALVTLLDFAGFPGLNVTQSPREGS